MNRTAASSVLLEVIATTVGDAKAAARAGADRLELVTAISEGGLTPGIGLIEAVVAAVPIPVNVIVRPHSRSFVYDADDLRVIERDVRAAVAAGANGVVFGALDARGDVDLDALARIAAAANGRDLTFHRAFDVSRDLNAAFDALHGWRIAQEKMGGKVDIDEIHENWYESAVNGVPKVEKAVGSLALENS